MRAEIPEEIALAAQETTIEDRGMMETHIRIINATETTANFLVLNLLPLANITGMTVKVVAMDKGLLTAKDQPTKITTEILLILKL